MPNKLKSHDLEFADWKARRRTEQHVRKKHCLEDGPSLTQSHPFSCLSYLATLIHLLIGRLLPALYACLQVLRPKTFNPSLLLTI